MKNTARRVLSMLMAIIMMCSVASPVLAEEETEASPIITADPAVSENNSDDRDKAAESPEEKAEDDPALQIESKSEADYDSINELNTEGMSGSAAAAEQGMALLRLTALYEGHRIHYVESGKHPLAGAAELHLG